MRFRHIVPIHLVMLCAATLFLTSPAAADRLTLRGTSIPLPECIIEGISAGRVQYRDAVTGRRQHREISQIASISFTDLPQLDAAEDALAEREYEKAIKRLLEALVHAETDVQRLWVRSVLARAHDAAGQYVQAAGHVAAVLLMDEHSAWNEILPLRDMEGRPPYAAAREAMENLREARRQLRSSGPAAMIEMLIERVQPIYEDVAADYAGEPIEPGSTVSGVPVARIRGGVEGPLYAVEDKPVDASPDDEREINEQPQRAGERQADPAPAPDSPEAIDALLAAERWDEALTLCRRIAETPGRRDLAEFLYQYGRALRGAAEHGEAAVMFTRCAILHRGTPHAIQSLIETALVYREVFNQPATARRLLQRALNEAEVRGEEDGAARARRLLDGFPDTG